MFAPSTSYLQSVSGKWSESDVGADSQWDAFPFSLPIVRKLGRLNLSSHVTFFVGENGSGKSTLLEAIAISADLPSLGSGALNNDPTLVAQRALAARLRLAWARRTRDGFFLRAEDFFGHLKSQARNDARVLREKLELHGIEATWERGSSHSDEVGATKFVQSYDSRSHGESFLDTFAQRCRRPGIYLLDEPEAPLSPSRQLALLALLMEARRGDRQFIIATHSPILLACPGARIYSFDAGAVTEATYNDLEHVALMKAFLNSPEEFLRRLSS
jgi:predicted ATPase